MSQQAINVADLDIKQLTEVKLQLDQELEHLTTSFGQLKQAQAKFKSCSENISQISSSNQDSSILVPLTNSLYVPGKIKDKGNVIIDVGTGYYVKKTTAEAISHYKSKVEFVTKNLETLQEAIQKKQDNLQLVVSIAQAKAVAASNAGAGSSGS